MCVVFEDHVGFVFQTCHLRHLSTTCSYQNVYSYIQKPNKLVFALNQLQRQAAPQMADSSSKKFNPSICQDIVGFEEYLKRLRVVDDTIILNLNNMMTWNKKHSEDKYVTDCNSFHNQLKEAYSGRDKVITTCLTEAENKVLQLKEAKGQDESNINLTSELKRHQARLRMIRKELSVEQIIQDRSLKALQERCRRYVNF